METKIYSEFKVPCLYCREDAFIQDEGQHITMFECEGCNRNNEVRHRPDPAPLPAAVNSRRIDVIQSVCQDFQQAMLLVPVKRDWVPWLGRVHQSAQDTVNHLFGYQGRKTIMVGRKKFTTAAVAPNGRAAVL